MSYQKLINDPSVTRFVLRRLRPDRGQLVWEVFYKDGSVKLYRV